MQDISLHLLDIIENSVRAAAKNIKVRVIKDHKQNLLRVIVEDDGVGMDTGTLEMAQNPFYSSKEKRAKKSGLGHSTVQAKRGTCQRLFQHDQRTRLRDRSDSGL